MSDDRVQQVIAAFNSDDYDVDATKDVFWYDGQLGVRATHRTAIVSGTDIRKKAFYVEGTGQQMGYLTGLMAEAEVTRMAIDYVNRVVLDFIEPGLGEEHPIIGAALAELVEAVVKADGMIDDLPPDLVHEMQGLADGCKAANPDTAVDFWRLVMLNAAVDVLVSMVYTLTLPDVVKDISSEAREALEDLFKPVPGLFDFGGGLEATAPEVVRDVEEQALRQRRLRVPIMCNAFSAFGAATKSGQDHFFGRDFMFPTCDVFQDVGCHIVRVPASDPDSDVTPLPTVSVCAPGFVGSVAVMNTSGVAAGVDMVPADCCDPNRPGLNSLLLIRQAVQTSPSASDAVDVIVGAQRGTSWLYPLSDGTNDKACTVEAGKKEDSIDFLDYPPDCLKWLLPDRDFLDAHQTAKVHSGVMERWNDYRYDSAYFDFNAGLFGIFWKTYDAAMMGVDAYIDASEDDKNCPMGFYFAPQREHRKDLLVTTNHYIIPEMRLTSMALAPTLICLGSFDDVQWRYDKLNDLLYEAIGPDTDPLEHTSQLDYDCAWSTINFRVPAEPTPDDVVGGSISLFDLKKLTVKSLYGTYADETVGITLMNYLAD